MSQGDPVEGGDVFGNIPDAPVKFEGAEHRSIGDSIKLNIPDSPAVDAANYVLFSVSDVDLTVGRVISLAGHKRAGYYNLRSPDIVGNERYGMGVSQGCLKLLDNEKAGLEKYEGLDSSFAQAYIQHVYGIPTDDNFLDATTSLLKGYLKYYGRIAWSNIDHFGKFAVKAYQTGHRFAYTTAYNAGLLHRPGTKDKALTQLKFAYLCDAFACHYLTDLFSTGHLRAQRSFLHHGGDGGMDLAAAGRMAEAALFKEAVWDLACRYMHDEDSATGLWVTNQYKQRWVAYGDKQFFNGHNRINRYLANQALSESMNEVWQAFQMGVTATTPSTPLGEPSYIALNRSPRLDDSANIESFWRQWGNPAPLWWNSDPVPLAPADKLHSQNWTRRKHIDNHSLYDYIPAYPGWKGHDASATEPPDRTADEVLLSRFVRFPSAQYPKTTYLEPLSGGFIQIQDIPPDPKFSQPGESRHAMNIWGPVSLQLDGENVQTFTLRNKKSDLGGVQFSTSLQWTTYFTASGKTIVLRYALAPDSSVMIDTWFLTMNQADMTTQMVPFEEMAKTPALPLSNAYEKAKTLIPGPTSFSGLIYTRFFTVPLLAGSAANAPNIVSIGIQQNETPPKYSVSICGTGKEFSDIYPQTVMSFNAKADLDHLTTGFFKSYRYTNNTSNVIQPSIIHVRGRSLDDKVFDINLAVLYETGQGPNLVELNYHLLALNYRVEGNNWQALVGDVLGEGDGDRLVIVRGVHPNIDCQFIKFNPQGCDPVKLGTPHLEPTAPGRPTFTAAQQVCTYMTALMPDEAAVIKTRQAVVSVSLFRDEKGACYINFRTFSNRGYEGKKSFDRCWDSAVVDDLQSDLGSHPNDFGTIAWFRTSCKTQDGGITKCGIIQVFSWYGLLGARLWAPKGPGKYGEWVLTGQTPMLGQTSIGTGYGIDGLWNSGMMTWGPAEEFADIVQCTNGTSMFQMDPADIKRQPVHGWEVSKRWDDKSAQ